jgi:tight adherence protein B
MTVIVVLVVATSMAFAGALDATRASAARRRLTPNVPRSIVRHPLVDAASDRVLRARRERAIEHALPDALDAIARSLRSGASLRLAIGEAAAGPLADDLGRVARDAADGVPLGVALDAWAAARPLPGVRLATAALGLGAETGGASAQAVDGVAATLRVHLAIAGEVRALSSQARMSALVIVLAPIAFTLLATSTDGRTARFLFATPFGWLCLALGLGLDAVGWLWMRRITGVVA